MDSKCADHGCYWKAENEHLKKCLLENFEEATAEINSLRKVLHHLVSDIEAGFPRDEGLDAARKILANE